MEDRIIQFRVGVMVIASFLVGGTLALWFGDGIRCTYTIYLKYPTAPGVAVDTPVRKNGIRIGRVSEVELLDDGVLLTMKIETGRVLRTSETPRLITASLLGDTVVEFVRKDERDIPVDIRIIQAGETLTGETGGRGPTEVFQLVAKMEHRIDAALGSIETAGHKIAALSEGLTVVVSNNEKHLATILEKSDQALGHFNQAMESMNGVIGDEELNGRLKQTVAELPEFLAQARQTLVDTRRTLASFEQSSQRAQRNLENLEQLTEPLGERGEELAVSIERSVKNVDELVAQLVHFSRALNDPRGSLGYLVHDRELSQRIQRAAGNIEEISRKLLPIMNDARVLADKLARDPSQLGIRGALARQRAGDGLKYPYLGGLTWERNETDLAKRRGNDVPRY